ncbi:spore germination protein [Bacillus sp. B190/17]|uniref:Spore germination protein n=1 Tax=Bacillus lumedeiriae TaxID=3058829 RepID=A0ABW8IAI7_9BACI
MWKKFNKGRLPFQANELSELLAACSESSDFLTFKLHKNSPFFIAYFKTLVNSETVHHDVLSILTEKECSTLEEIKEKLPIEGVTITEAIPDVREKLLTGSLLIYTGEKNASCLLVPVPDVQKRQVSVPETESSVLGPKVAFVESLDTNLNLIRNRLHVLELQTKELSVGKLSKTRVAVVYVKGIADEENVNTVIQRIGAIDYDEVIDSSFLTQMMADNGQSPFPQFIETERPDRVTGILSEGKVAILVEGSPIALTAPATFFEFFSASEDYFALWNVASFLRLLRLFAMMLSIWGTPAYVAILTYHYEMIPQDLLGTLISSRAGIPFPPILEAIILELTIELLREAGARLPTKVGQTIGIVGGIVIGTAAVQAGLTSNVLIIIVALSALASFTAPVYGITNGIRLIRFPFLLFAQLLGLLGMAVCAAFLLAHLLKLTSLGRPFLEPLYPLRLPDLKDSFIRLPFNKQEKRPLLSRPKDDFRFQPKALKKNNWDIDD